MGMNIKLKKQISAQTVTCEFEHWLRGERRKAAGTLLAVFFTLVFYDAY